MNATTEGAIVETFDLYGRRTHRGVARYSGHGDAVTVKTVGAVAAEVGDRVATTRMVAGAPVIEGHRVTAITRAAGFTTITARTDRPSCPQ